MGFYFRKRLGLGPLALNFGKSGIGISAGVRGLRADVGAHGWMYMNASGVSDLTKFFRLSHYRVTAITSENYRQVHSFFH